METELVSVMLPSPPSNFPRKSITEPVFPADETTAENFDAFSGSVILILSSNIDTLNMFPLRSASFSDSFALIFDTAMTSPLLSRSVKLAVCVLQTTAPDGLTKEIVAQQPT